jgi:hypothetical protein
VQETFSMETTPIILSGNLKRGTTTLRIKLCLNHHLHC